MEILSAVLITILCILIPLCGLLITYLLITRKYNRSRNRDHVPNALNSGHGHYYPSSIQEEICHQNISPPPPDTTFESMRALDLIPTGRPNLRFTQPYRPANISNSSTVGASSSSANSSKSRKKPMSFQVVVNCNFSDQTTLSSSDISSMEMAPQVVPNETQNISQQVSVPNRYPSRQQNRENEQYLRNRNFAFRTHNEEPNFKTIS